MPAESSVDPPHGVSAEAFLPVSATQRVLSQLRREVITAELEPGGVIRESEIAARFGVSKTPVREALQTLLIEDFVTVFPRRGYMVRPVGINDIGHMMALRSYIEPQLTGIAALERNQLLIEDLEAALQRQHEATHDFQERLAGATEFHWLIARVSKNDRALRLLRNYFDETTRLHYVFKPVREHVVSHVELNAHRKILDAIIAGDPDRARQGMQSHLNEAKETLLRSFY
ncbi:GntR family transcriptional regulator [Nesterenkonia sp. MY13]|uniref:GntR family transcriptional regulator n=1 Tax=Nesterenkonia sedimenti TaxID=1463632 RepID=A0A7X8TJH5_9MICC|nr:GntR family transcriptional regulator [Nesterenkonia sedimenti]NLS09238.1 GntR family transcriptional regulator [Nesterenkonia sedimenti]